MRTDVFRPFAAGVLFGMRRGMTTDCGTIIVPHSKSIVITVQNNSRQTFKLMLDALNEREGN